MNVVQPDLAAAEVAAATLVCLPEMGPSRLRAVLDRWPNPGTALAAIRDGRACDALRPDARSFGPHGHQELARRWARAAHELDLAPALARRGTTVLLDGDDDYPISDDVPDRPAVLLLEGSAPDVLGRPRVAIVGTRSATVHGLADARELGAFLARCGVTVVSGMAIGVDGAAHVGALDAGGGAVGVVATGLDIVYPRRQVVLFERVRAAGVLLSETGFGIGANRFRFPVRNRIIAALANIPKRECAGGWARGLVARLLGADDSVIRWDRRPWPSSHESPVRSGLKTVLRLSLWRRDHA
jgi:DNA processing protein